MAKIILEKSKCIGCGVCGALCPEFFELKNGKSHIKNSKENSDSNEELETDKLDCSEQAAESCPVQCIQVIK